MTVDVRADAIAVPTGTESTHDPIVADGITLLADGQFQEALAPLRLALAAGDIRPSTILNLAIAEDRTGNREHARRLMRHVADRLPTWDEPVIRLAESLRAAGEIDAAENAYRHTLGLNPTRTEALIALSGLLLMRNQADEARDLLLRCCGIDPNNAEAWNALGLALRMRGEPGLALSAFVRAQGLCPNHPGYVLNGVEVTEEAKQADAELARLIVACEQNPLSVALQVGRGVLLERMGHRTEAIDALEAATDLAPGELVPMRLLGAALIRAGRNPQAAAVLRRMLAIDPEDAIAGNDLAVVLMRLQRNAEARAILRSVLQRHGPQREAMCNLANATVAVGLQEEAIALAESAIRAEPTEVLPRRALCNTLAYQANVTGTSMLAVMRDCSNVLARSPQPSFANNADPHRPLVVGLLSGSLQIHPVGWLTIGGIETLDRNFFNVICLTQSTSQDLIGRRFRAACHEWVEVDRMTDQALVNAARARDIDILIDLGGYGHAGRMPACANRLAPVQIKWVGMQSHSSGLAEMDWFLTDRWETPDGFEPFYSEKLLRLPDGYVCYSPPPYAPDIVVLPALTKGFVTFGCFNNLAKITPRVIETWAEVLRRVPRSRLILKTHQFSHQPTADGLLADFAALGISCNRIELRGSSGHRAFMGQYGDVDVVLDPFPYSGGLTTCEALWMGVPTITLPGEIFASRHSTSHMSNAGLADWVTGSVEAYIGMAVARAGNLTALAELRVGLRERVRQSPLCDAPRFGHGLGAALRHAWQEWCAEKLLQFEKDVKPRADNPQWCKPNR